MNACMQDAFNLGWKLSLVIKGLAPDSILDTYQRERKPIAEQVTEGSNRMHQVLFNANVSIADRYKLTQDQSWHDEAIYRISGLSHNYDTGAAGNLPLLERIASVQPGIRAADVVMTKAAPRRRLYDVFRHTEFTFLLLPSEGAKNGDVSRTTAAAVKRRYGHRVVPSLLAKRSTASTATRRSKIHQKLCERRTAAMARVRWFWCVPTCTWITSVPWTTSKDCRDICNSIG